jgi:hypothetical protein
VFSLELSPITPNHLIVCTLDVRHRRARTGRGAGRRFAGVFVTALTSIGVSVLLTSELEDHCTDLRFSPYGTAFLTDAIIVQRYIEVQSRLLASWRWSRYRPAPIPMNCACTASMITACRVFPLVA